MFTEVLSDLPLTDIQSSINAVSFKEDKSFCATLRALFFNRNYFDKTITVQYKILNVPLKVDEGMESFVDENITIPVASLRDYIQIISFRNISNETFSSLINEFKVKQSEYLNDKIVSLYLSYGNRYHIEVFRCNNTKNVIIIAQKLNIKIWHYLQSALIKLIPWYFEEPLNDFEKDLLKSLTKSDSRFYLNIVKSYANNLNFRELKVRFLLKDFEISYDKIRLAQIINHRDLLMSEFSRLQSDIQRCLQKDRELQLEMVGVQDAINSNNNSELMQYFICNKYLNIISCSNNTFNYISTGYLEYYDIDLFERCLKNKNSYFYTDMPSQYSSDLIEKLLSSLFGDNRKLKIKVCAEFEFCLYGTIRPIQNSKYLSDFSNHLAHPHLNKYACLGSNSIYINEFMRDKKYIEAIEQTVASIKNINFADTVVSSAFIRELFNSNKKFLELPDGNSVSSSDAITWLGENN